MKYIRTKDGRILIAEDNSPMARLTTNRVADTVEELCDELVIKYKSEKKPRYVDMNDLMKSCDSIGVAFREHMKWVFDNYKDQLEICKLAIWTDKGLVYVAKPNEKGEPVLL